jgi:hypothetical protein
MTMLLILCKSKLNSSQHGFMTTKYTLTKLIIFLDFVIPLVRSQGQTGFIYFGLGNAFDSVPRVLLFQTLNNNALSLYIHSPIRLHGVVLQ